jgi:hypothetical protein
VSALTLAVDAAAAYRLTRLVTADEITEEPREAIVRTSFRSCGIDVEFVDEETAVDVVARYRIENGPPPKLATLVTCRWCAGVWIGFGVIAARRLVPRFWSPVADALACAAAAALLAGFEE